MNEYISYKAGGLRANAVRINHGKNARFVMIPILIIYVTNYSISLTGFIETAHNQNSVSASMRPSRIALSKAA